MKSKSAAIAPDTDWRAEDDMRTLARAEEIKKDRTRYRAALAKAREKMAELQALQGATAKK